MLETMIENWTSVYECDYALLVVSSTKYRIRQVSSCDDQRRRSRQERVCQQKAICSTYSNEPSVVPLSIDDMACPLLGPSSRHRGQVPRPMQTGEIAASISHTHRCLHSVPTWTSLVSIARRLDHRRSVSPPA